MRRNSQNRCDLFLVTGLHLKNPVFIIPEQRYTEASSKSAEFNSVYGPRMMLV
jgi:hypothetical protein